MATRPAAPVYWRWTPTVRVPFLRGRSDNRTITNRPARRRGSYRANRPAIRPMATSNASRHRAGAIRTLPSRAQPTGDIGRVCLLRW